MRILFVNTKFGFQGGVESYIFKTANLLNQNGHSCLGLFEEKPFNLNNFDSVFDKSFFYNNQTLEQLHFLFSKIDLVLINKITDLKLLKMLNANFKTIVIVHDHDFYCPRKHKYSLFKKKNCSEPFDRLRCSFCSLLIERSENNLLPFSIISVRDKELLLNEIKKADAFVVLSEFMKLNLKMNNFAEERIFKIYPFIEEAENEFETEKETNQILFVGSLIYGKGIKFLMEIANKIKSDFRLKIVGKGNLTEELAHNIRLFGLEKKIELIGWTNEIEQYYFDSKVLIAPAYWQEPFGLVGVEAFNHKVPVVGFDSGGINEWLHDGKNGFLIPQYDTTLFAEKIDYLLNTKNDLGYNGFTYVNENYRKSNFIKAFNNVTEKIL